MLPLTTNQRDLLALLMVYRSIGSKEIVELRSAIHLYNEWREAVETIDVAMFKEIMDEISDNEEEQRNEGNSST